jgi:hypothetical protein
MQKTWKKTGAASYELFIDGVSRGGLEFNLASANPKARINCNNDLYTLRRMGLFGSNCIIENSTGAPVLELKANRWYGSSYTLLFENERYRLLVRNNPLSEWVILKEETPVLSYALGKPVETAGKNCPLLFDFLIWYFFAPIAAENNDPDLLLLAL